MWFNYCGEVFNVVSTRVIILVFRMFFFWLYYFRCDICLAQFYYYIFYVHCREYFCSRAVLRFMVAKWPKMAVCLRRSNRSKIHRQRRLWSSGVIWAGLLFRSSQSLSTICDITPINCFSFPVTGLNRYGLSILWQLCDCQYC